MSIVKDKTNAKRAREEEVPPLDDLLVALDVAPREEEQEAVRTVDALVDRAKLDGVASREYLVLALLVAFRRRNHAASQADGLGSGERKFLQTILAAVAPHAPTAVQLVLPLVPLYGCWKDLRLLAEALLTDEKGGSAEADGELPEIVDTVCECFALQLTADKSELEAEDKLPSSAAKYSPHEGRHSGKSSDGARATNRLLADAIARKLGLGDGVVDKHALRRRYRLIRSACNKKLAEKGFLLEPLLAARRLDAIQFTKAPKTALSRCKKAIMKNPMAAARWKKAMASSSKAVPDITDLLQAAGEALEEANEPDAEMRFAPRRLLKAIATAGEQRSALQAKAREMLEQLEGATGADAAVGALRDGVAPPALPIVLTSGATGALRAGERADHSLLMAAFILARAQGLPLVAVDGALVAVADEDGAAAAEAAAMAEPSFDAFVARAHEAARTPRAMAGSPTCCQRLLEGGAALLNSMDGTAADLVAICSTFGAGAEADELSKATALLKAEGMRALLVHRVRQAVVTGGEEFQPFEPRALRPMPARGAEVVDVCFVLDLTGSMGTWIRQCKDHIASIIQTLRSDLDVGEVRVAFVGYRDWGERHSGGRLVTKDFVPMARVGEVSAVIAAEDASGGGDGPEDVISAMEAARHLAWKGDMRVCVFIADAPAHGYSPCSGGDDFPRGMCPDQHTPLPKVTAKLANEKGVDLLCAQLNGQTDKMFSMFAECYPGGAGFGVLPLDAAAFQSALLGTLSSAMLSLIAPSVKTPGVQTFDGSTLSALISTLNASLRETVDAAAAQLRAPSADEEAAARAERQEVIAAAVERVERLEAAVSSATEAERDGGELAAARARLDAVKSRAPPTKAARGDAARLRAALEADELRPVRLALGLPVPTEALAVEAAASLLKAGVCVGDMVAKGYPEPFITAMQASAATLMRRI